MKINRRRFLYGSAAAGLSASAGPLGLPVDISGARPVSLTSLDFDRHRFGVNYTPSRRWWFCWNDWDADSIQRDLDAIASLAADHLRLLLIWPYFQPNPSWVSPLHLQRLDQLLALMSQRNLDALITVFTGQLSGWFFLPPFNRAGEDFFTDSGMRAAQEYFFASWRPS